MKKEGSRQDILMVMVVEVTTSLCSSSPIATTSASCTCHCRRCCCCPSSGSLGRSGLMLFGFEITISLTIFLPEIPGLCRRSGPSPSHLSIVGAFRPSRRAISLERAGRHGRGWTTPHRSGGRVHPTANSGEDPSHFARDPRLVRRLGLSALDRLRERGRSARPLAIDSDNQEIPVWEQLLVSLPSLVLGCTTQGGRCGGGGRRRGGRE